MPAISLSRVGVNDPPPWHDVATSDKVIQSRADWRMSVVEKGMTSGEPAVGLTVEIEGVHFVLETSLNALITATQGLRTMAEVHFGWKQKP